MLLLEARSEDTSHGRGLIRLFVFWYSGKVQCVKAGYCLFYEHMIQLCGSSWVVRGNSLYKSIEKSINVSNMPINNR